MEVFIHHIYEYQKGIRNLILHTTDKSNIEIIKENLRNYKQITVIKYHNSNILNTTKSECLVIL